MNKKAQKWTLAGTALVAAAAVAFIVTSTSDPGPAERASADPARPGPSTTSAPGTPTPDTTAPAPSGSPPSGSAPTTLTASIDALAPGTGEDVTITWSSAGGDGSPLTHTLLYSADSGATWELIGVELTGTSTDFPRWSLPGGDHARLKVIVSDGQTSTEAMSPDFSLANLAPTVDIDNARDGATFSGSQTFVLDANAYDTEDGELDDDAVSWSSDLDGPLTTGQELYSRADELTEGTHLLTATATDSAGATATASVVVHIKRIG
ncbi:MAG TPA: hypothetical protein VK883_15710 [Arthrobacter sp.]|nr:hypothetical protein [Arthrobacter sp.]